VGPEASGTVPQTVRNYPVSATTVAAGAHGEDSSGVIFY
jgi:hypothetical protein